MAQTKIPHKVDSSISHNPLNETLIFPATLYMMKKSLKYLQKPVFILLEIINISSKHIQSQVKLDLSDLPNQKIKEKTLSILFEKNLSPEQILLTITLKTLSHREMADSEKDSDNSYLSGISPYSKDFSPLTASPNNVVHRPHKSFEINNQEDSLINLKNSRHHPSERLKSPPKFFFKTPSFTMEEGDSQFISIDKNGKYINKNDNEDKMEDLTKQDNEFITITEEIKEKIEGSSQFLDKFSDNSESIRKIEPNDAKNIEFDKKNTHDLDKKPTISDNNKNIKGIKVHISRSDLTKFLKKDTNVSVTQEDEGAKYKEKEELLNKILILEKMVQRKNELLEENLNKINEFHQMEENFKLQFYKQSKENSNKIKSLLSDVEQLRQKNLNFSQNILTIKEELQFSQGILLHKDQELKNLYHELDQKKEEIERLKTINISFSGENQDFEIIKRNYLKELDAFNEKIKSLYERNEELREKLDLQSNEIVNMNAQKDFLLNLYEKSKEDLEIQEKKHKEDAEMLNFYITNYRKNEELLTEMKKELSQKALEREEALSKQTSLIIELQNLKFKYLRKKPEKPIIDENNAEEIAFLRKENQLLQKKLDLLMISFSDEKAENSEIHKKQASEIDKLNKELSFSEKRRLELETEMIQMAKSSKVFLISEEFENMRKKFEVKLKFFQENNEKLEIRIKEILDENEKLRNEISENCIELKKIQMKHEDFQSLKSEDIRKSTLGNEILREKDQIIENCHEKIKDLMEENESLKEKFEDFRRSKEGKESDFEMEMTRIEIEKDKLFKKLKENEQKLEVLLKEKRKFEQEIKELKEREGMMDEKLSFREKELGESKEKIGNLLMKAVEIGGNELLDKMTGIS